MYVNSGCFLIYIGYITKYLLNFVQYNIFLLVEDIVSLIFVICVIITKVVYKTCKYAKIAIYTLTANALKTLYYTNYIQILKIVF